jgi:hypothetical protein
VTFFGREKDTYFENNDTQGQELLACVELILGDAHIFEEAIG